jgi:hypothetical protein
MLITSDAVILSEAKNLLLILILGKHEKQILRFAQNDRSAEFLSKLLD